MGDQVRSNEELRLLLKQENWAFMCLVEEAEMRSNGDASLKQKILEELVLLGLRERKHEGKLELPQLLPVVPKKRMRDVYPSPSSPSLDLGLGFPTENPSKKRPRPKKGISQRMVNGKEEEGKKKKRPRVSRKEAERLRERGSLLGLPEDVRARMEELGGADPVLVITKYLYQTDMSTHHMRLNLPVGQLEKGVGADSKFLTTEEWRRMLGNTDEAVKVRLVGPSCSDPTEVSLKCWWMNKAPILVMTTGWVQFVAKEEVKEGDAVQVWASRCNGGRDGVVLALVVVEPAAPADLCLTLKL